MEELFKQSFNYAVIRIYKNYSDRLSKNFKLENINLYRDLEEIDPFQEPVRKFTVTDILTKPSLCSIKLFGKGYKKINFFYSDTPIIPFQNHSLPGSPTFGFEPIELCNPMERNGQEKDYFETTKDRHIKAHYNNPFASIQIVKIERWIKRDGDKITMKFYKMIRSRDVNCIYFSKISASSTVTFNIHTGNFTVITFSSRKKKKVKHFYCNSFNALKTSLPTFYNIKETNVNKTSSIYKEYIDTFNTNQFQFAIEKILELTGISFSEKNDILAENFVSIWMQRFVEIKKIKLPNDNGYRLLKWYYPTEKYLKKNDRKLVAAVLDRFGMKSNITIKILHQYPNTHIVGLLQLCQIFGSKYPQYIGNINNYFFSKDSYRNDLSAKSILLDSNNRKVYNISDIEKENITHIINDRYSMSENINILSSYGIISSFMDHFDIIEKIKTYYPGLKLNAKKWKTFNAEHSLYSKYEREIKKGYSSKIIFDPDALQEIEKPIEVIEHIKTKPLIYFNSIRDQIENHVISTQRVFLPKLLRSSDDYYEEGAYMNHCVAGYLDGCDYSIIISLRLNEERVTSEFTVKDRKCIQSRYFNNQDPPEHFKKALETLYNRMRSIPFPIKPIDKKKTPLIINGVSVKIEETEDQLF